MATKRLLDRGEGYADEVTSVMRYFETLPPKPCVTCDRRPEARPGVRLCRSCLHVAAAVFAEIERQEASEKLAGEEG